jgi:uncharacterized membrane protein
MDMLYLENKYFLIALTFVVYLCAQLLQRRTGLAFLNPILLTIVVLIVVLLGAGIDYETYEEGGSYIDFWLKPAVVALGVPLYRQLESIKKQLLPILVAELAGCIAGIVSVVVVAELFGASRDVIVSLAPKSVTTPIAMEVAQTMNGIPAHGGRGGVHRHIRRHGGIPAHENHQSKKSHRAGTVDWHCRPCRRHFLGNGCGLSLWRLFIARAYAQRPLHRDALPVHPVVSRL